MPRTTHGIIDNEPVRQWAIIVRTVSANSEHVETSAHQQHLLIRHVPDQLPAVGEFREGNSLREIWADWSSMI